jgi:hypothetical protein
VIQMLMLGLARAVETEASPAEDYFELQLEG